MNMPCEPDGRRWKQILATAALLLPVLLFVGPRHAVSPREAGTRVDIPRNTAKVSLPLPALVTGIADREIAPAGGWFHTRLEEAPAWTVGFGQEFWRATGVVVPPPITGAATTTNRPPVVNTGEVIERVTHAFARDEQTGEPMVKTPTYQAAFDENGLRFTPANSASTSALDHGDATLDFRTKVVQRGDAVVFAPGQPVTSQSVLGNTAQRLLAPGVIEHYEARANGVAVTWVLNQPPAGTGALNITSQVTGLDYAGQTPGGHHYADATGVARTRIGQVVAVDQAGRRWPLTATAAGNTLAITVPEAIVATAKYPLAIDPVISPEFGVDNPALSDPITGSAASVAGNGDGYLVTWCGANARPGVWAGRLSRTGEVLDPAGFLVYPEGSFSQNPPYHPVVASNGRDYLVAWFGGYGNRGALKGRRFLANGLALDPQPLLLATNASSIYLGLASNGSGYLATWTDRQDFPPPVPFGWTVYGARLTDAGATPDGEGFVIDSDGREGLPGVIAIGKEYLVTWASRTAGRSGMRLKGEGPFLDSNRVNLSAWESALAFGGYGTNILAALPGATSVGVQFLDFNGQKVTNSIPVLNAGETSGGSTFATSRHGFLLVWTNFRKVNQVGRPFIHAARFNEHGQLLDPQGFQVAEPAGYVLNLQAASDGENYLVVWDTITTVQPTRVIIRSALVMADGTVGATKTVPAPAPNQQSDPAVAFNGTNYLVAWTDERNYDKSWGDIFGARISPVGHMLDPVGIPICAHPAAQSSPRVAASGSQFAVVWQDRRGGGASNTSFCAILDADGAVTPQNGRALPTADGSQGNLGLASSGTNFLLICTAYTLSPIWRRVVYGQVFDARGSNSAVTLISEVPDAASPAVAGNGTEYLVVWTSYDSAAKEYAIYGTRVRADGTPVLPDSQRLASRGTASGPPALASDGDGYLLVWEHAGAPAGNGIVAARIRSGGLGFESGPVRVSSSPSRQSWPQVTYSGHGYWVAWVDGREGPNAGTVVYAAEVAPDGRPWPGTESRVSPATITGMYGLPYPFVLAPGPAGQAALAYVNPVAASYRVAGRLLSSSPLKVSANEAVLVWPANPGATYRVQHAAELGSTNWTDLPGDVLATSDRALKSDASITNVPRRFYRVIKLP